MMFCPGRIALPYCSSGIWKFISTTKAVNWNNPITTFDDDAKQDEENVCFNAF